MYRQNKLKEELDRLREENKRLELKNVYLREIANTLQAELYNIRLQMQNDKLNDALIKSILGSPIMIDKEKTKDLEDIKEEFEYKDWRITYDS